MGQDLGANVIEAEVQTDEALEGVKDLPQLRKLHLFSKRVTDVGIAASRKCEPTGNTVPGKDRDTDEGVRKLQKALPKCRIIR